MKPAVTPLSAERFYWGSVGAGAVFRHEQVNLSMTGSSRRIHLS